jgi:hypothetical protein
MLVKDKKYAVAVSDMQGWRISEFQHHESKRFRIGLSGDTWRVSCVKEERGRGDPGNAFIVRANAHYHLE